jgi:hypothetical protein
MHKDIYYQTFGPITNYYGYVIHLAVIDDLFMTKVFTPYRTKQIRYFFDEEILSEYIDLINEDRRF